MVKSAAGAETTTVRVVEWLRAPLVQVMVIGYEPAGVVVPVTMLRLEVVEPPDGGVTVLGVTEHVALGGQPDRTRPTAALNPFNEVTVTVPEEVPDVPAVNVSGEADAEMLKSDAPVQLANLKDPIAVLHTKLEVAV